VLGLAATRRSRLQLTFVIRIKRRTLDRRAVVAQLMDRGRYLPVFAAVAAPHASDPEFLRRQNLPRGSIAVFARAA
jgi:hypothetical protein